MIGVATQRPPGRADHAGAEAAGPSASPPPMPSPRDTPRRRVRDPGPRSDRGDGPRDATTDHEGCAYVRHVAISLSSSCVADTCAAISVQGAACARLCPPGRNPAGRVPVRQPAIGIPQLSSSSSARTHETSPSSWRARIPSKRSAADSALASASGAPGLERRPSFPAGCGASVTGRREEHPDRQPCGEARILGRGRADQPRVQSSSSCRPLAVILINRLLGSGALPWCCR